MSLQGKANPSYLFCCEIVPKRLNIVIGSIRDLLIDFWYFYKKMLLLFDFSDKRQEVGE